MMTVSEVSRKTGVSVRTLHHYDSIGLLKPAQVSSAGYRLYDEKNLVRLQCILLFRELEFSLEDIRRIMESPSFDQNRALEQQIRLLEMKREHIDNLLVFARGICMTGVNRLKDMNFEPFDTKKLDRYAQEARASWGETPAYKEYQQKSKGRSREDEQLLGKALMNVLGGFAPLMGRPPEDEAVQAQVQALRDFISGHYYTCTPEILRSLGSLYGGGGAMTENINKTCGEGVAEFAAKAVEAYCRER